MANKHGALVQTMLGVSAFAFVATLICLVATAMWASAWWNREQVEAAFPLAERITTRAEFDSTRCINERTTNPAGSLSYNLQIRYRYVAIDATGEKQAHDIADIHRVARDRVYSYASRPDCEADRINFAASRPSVEVWYAKTAPDRANFVSERTPGDDRAFTIVFAIASVAFALIGIWAAKRYQRLAQAQGLISSND
jgi:hypothetical protein